MQAVLFAGVHRPHDVRMIEPAHRFHLAFKPADGIGALQLLGRQHFQSDDLVELEVAGFVDGAHSAFADLFEELIDADRAKRFACRGR